MTGPAFEPPHPGEYLREEVLPTLKLSLDDASDKLGVNKTCLAALIRPDAPAPLTPELALRLGKLTGTSPRIWLKLQNGYDLWHAEREIDISSIPTLHAAE